MEKTKVTIVGAGAVGSATAFALAGSGLAREIVLQDLNIDRARAEALDIEHGSLFYPAVDIKASSDPASAKDSDAIVITAGARQKPGQTRIDLAGDTIKIMEAVIPPLVEVAPNATFIIVANPVDVATYVCQKVSKLPENQVFGSGTVLDSSRLRTLLATTTGVNPKNIHAYIAGEHGDSEIPLWSSATIGNIPLLDFREFDGCPPLTDNLRKKIHKEVVNAAYKVIEGKGVTNYAIALATLDILTAVLRDERRIMPISMRIDSLEGVSDVCMSLPSLIGRQGVICPLNVTLSRDEIVGLQASAKVLRDTLAKFGY
jgi:L-lactate dehydrogenase